MKYIASILCSILFFFSAYAASEVKDSAEYRMVIGIDITPSQTYSKDLVKRAGKGDARAMIDLGDCYFTGNGVSTDAKKASELYEKVTKIKNLEPGIAEEAYRKFARCYYDWEGVEKNHAKLEKIYNKAAKAEIMPIAQTLLCIYENGFSDDKPLYNAYRMRQILVNNGFNEYLPGLLEDYIVGRGIKQNPERAAIYINRMREIPEMRDTLNSLIRIGRKLSVKAAPEVKYVGSTYKLSESLTRISTEFFSDLAIKEKIDEGLSYFSGDAMLANAVYKVKKKLPAHLMKEDMMLICLFSTPKNFAKSVSGLSDQEYYKTFLEIWLKNDPMSLIQIFEYDDDLSCLPGLADALRSFMHTPEGKEYADKIRSTLRSR